MGAPISLDEVPSYEEVAHALRLECLRDAWAKQQTVAAGALRAAEAPLLALAHLWQQQYTHTTVM